MISIIQRITILLAITQIASARLRAVKKSIPTEVKPKIQERRKLDTAAFHRRALNVPQYTSQSNNIVKLINQIQPEARVDEHEVRTIPSTDQYLNNEILGNLNGLLSQPSVMLSYEPSYTLSMQTIEPNYDSTVFDGVVFADLLQDDKIYHPEVLGYKENHIPEGTYRGALGIFGSMSTRHYIEITPSIDNSIPDVQTYSPYNDGSAPSQYMVSTFGLVDLSSQTEKLLDENVYKPVQKADDVPIGRLEGLIRDSRFNNDEISISMILQEPNMETIYTSTYFPLLNMLDEHQMVKTSSEAYQKPDLDKSEDVLGLFGEVYSNEAVNPYKDDELADRLNTYELNEVFGLVDLIQQPPRVRDIKDAVPSTALFGVDEVTVLGNLNGRVGDSKYDIPMTLQEPHMDSIYTSTYMPFFNILHDEQQMPKAHEDAYKPVERNTELLGRVGSPINIDQLDLVTLVDRTPTYDAAEAFVLIEGISEAPRVEVERYTQPLVMSRMGGSEEPSYLGNVSGRIESDGILSYAKELLKYGADTNDKHVPSLSKGSSTGGARYSIGILSTVDKVTQTRFNGAGSILAIKQDLNGLDFDLKQRFT